MDRRGSGGWGSSGEQDQSNSSKSGGSDGAPYPSDAFCGSGAPSDPYDGERRCYSTNNNDYSKYPGGESEYVPPATAYDTHGSRPGGYYAAHPSSPGYLDGQGGYGGDYSHTGSSDYLQPKRTDNLSDYGSSQCYRDPSDQGYDACSRSGYSDYSQYSRQEYTPSRVQVTAKVLFGSVSAISNLKQKKNTKKK